MAVTTITKPHLNRAQQPISTIARDEAELDNQLAFGRFCGQLRDAERAGDLTGEEVDEILRPYQATKLRRGLWGDLMRAFDPGSDLYERLRNSAPEEWEADLGDRAEELGLCRELAAR
jgi:hypothetical protein